jgi:hypothetical protein
VKGGEFCDNRGFPLKAALKASLAAGEGLQAGEAVF